ncbi:MAG TPA: TetR/AcrR family transcriptional regulator [Galbitalea sp.]|jgi:AcrR family transcriptional regulator|nr:TetR/AcrR family transcriptional regulator [Galbitalea sp.]
MARTDERGGPATRARIREVANRMFIERGFDSVTVAEVAREAGVSTVTVFNHFPTKEDLFLDRVDDAVEFLQSAVRDRDSDADIVESLRKMTLDLVDSRHPLSGVDERSMPFFRTVAASPALVARARAITAQIQRVLADELDRDPRFDGDAGLLAAFFVAGYSAVLVETAQRVMAGEALAAIVDAHRARFDLLFDALLHGFPGK